MCLACFAEAPISWITPELKFEKLERYPVEKFVRPRLVASFTSYAGGGNFPAQPLGEGL